MIVFEKTHRSSYDIKINNKNDVLKLMQYLEDLEMYESIEMLYNEKIYKLLINLTETSNNIKFDNQNREIIMDLELEDVEAWAYGLEVSLVEKHFCPAELFGFDLKGKSVDTYMNITLE